MINTRSPNYPLTTREEFLDSLGSIFTYPDIHLHLSAQRNYNRQIRRIFRIGACIFHLAHYIHTIHHFAKHHVFVVEEGCRDRGDEELGAVCVGTGVLVGGRGVSFSVGTESIE
jgi:hypothetical protein